MPTTVCSSVARRLGAWVVVLVLLAGLATVFSPQTAATWAHMKEFALFLAAFGPLLWAPLTTLLLVAMGLGLACPTRAEGLTMRPLVIVLAVALVGLFFLVHLDTLLPGLTWGSEMALTIATTAGVAIVCAGLSVRGPR